MPSDRAGLHVSAITVTVGSRGEAQRIVDIDALAIEPGARIGLAGPSGSGKTSLLHVFAGLLRPEAGKVVWNGTDIATLGEVARDAWRRANVGMVFQDFLLVPELSALENVLLPCSFGGAPAGDHRAAAIALLAETGIITTHDLHATVLHLLGINHERLTYRYSGRNFRLTDVAGVVAKDILS